MQRARTGLTGLALVFIVVLLASIILGNGRGTAETRGSGETLAVLGVTPGTTPAPANSQ